MTRPPERDGDPYPPGTLLLAEPSQHEDPTFGDAVILVFDREPNGISTGLLLNRPTERRAIEETAVAALLLPDAQAPVFRGGPMGQQPSILAEVDRPDGLEWFHLPMEARRPFPLPNVAVVALGEHADAFAERIRRARLYVGLCVWGRNQLEREVERGDWATARAEPGDVFCEAPEALWARVRARLE